MSREFRQWTELEVFKLRKLLNEGKTRKQIAAYLGFPLERVSSRIRHENRTPEHRKEKVARARERRNANKENYKSKTVRSVIHDPVSSYGRPTLEMLAEAQRRLEAPRSLTAEFCGDPGVGYSALDRRQSA